MAASDPPSLADTIMTTETAGWVLVLFLPFLLSLAARVSTPKVLCFVISAMALLLSVHPYSSVLPWGLGMAIAVVSVRERIRSAHGP
jgi:hypothetical protein